MNKAKEQVLPSKHHHCISNVGEDLSEVLKRQMSYEDNENRKEGWS